MNSNLNPSDRAAIVGVIDPDLNTAGTAVTAWVDMAKWGSLMAVIATGTLGTNATVDAKLQQATTVGGANAKDIPGKAITQFTDAGGDSDKQAIINLFANELDMNNGFTFVQLSLTVATASSDSTAFLLGFDPRYGTAKSNDAATVDEVVN
jgi:hypothetical protein